SHGLLGGSSLTEVDNYPHSMGQTGTRTITIPRDASGGQREGAEAMKRLRQRIDERAAVNERLRRLIRQVRMVDTTEGVRIDLVDDADFSMFVLGTTVLTADAAVLIDTIADAVRSEQGRLTIRGHTDALPWKSGAPANNWS